MTKRASIFGDDTESETPDLSDFKLSGPRQPIDTAALREVAEASGFRSREPGAAEPAATPAAPARRRRAARPLRSVQLNVRITAGHQARFFACLDQLGADVSQADGIELAIEKLEASLRDEAR